jgi:WD40 repeat protein
MTDIEDQILNRHFVVIATSEYDNSHTYGQLKGVKDEVALMLGWFTSREKVGDRRFKQQHEGLASNPGKRQIGEALEDPQPDVRWGSADAAVVYITGHGERQGSGEQAEHYLVLKPTDKNRLGATGFRTLELLDWLVDSKIEYLLVIVDVCYAGQISARVEARAKEHWLILPSATNEQRARMGVLTKGIRDFVDKGAAYNRHSPYLPVGVFVSAINAMLPPTQQVKHIYKGTPGSDGQPAEHPAQDEHVCLPNPHYDPRYTVVRTSPAVRDLALREQVFDLHNRVAGGLPTDDHPGWLFTCRATLMRDLIAAVGRPGVTIVTGSVGSGKSTALSRLVTLSDPVFLAEHASELTGVPAGMLSRLRSVDVAVSSRKRTNLDVVTLLCHHLLHSLPRPIPGEDQVATARRALAEHLAEADEPVTVVVDAIDEAETPSSLIQNVLVPLADVERSQLCLIIGVRSPREDDATSGPATDRPLRDLAAATADPDWIYVDRSPWWSDGDIAAFVRNILINKENSRYRDAPELILAGFTGAITGVASFSYLIAELAADSLARQTTVITPNDRRWRDNLDGDLVGILRNNLNVTVSDPELRRRSLVLLRATAFARGGGLPWVDVWPTVANAADVGGERKSTYGDPDIERLLGSGLNAFLAMNQEDDLTVYRLMHYELRSTLQYRWRELLKEESSSQDGSEDALPEASEEEIAATEAGIAAELRPRAISPTAEVDATIPPYVRRHLTEHALAGGVLAESVPIPFLPYLDLGRLRAAIAASPDRRQLEMEIPWLRMLRQITHLWDWNRPVRNAAAIEMWSALNEVRLPGAEKRFGPVGGSWHVPWAVQPPGSGSRLGQHEAVVLAAAATDLSGVPVAVTGDDKGQLYVWDLSRGTPYHAPITTGDDAVRSIVVTYLPDNSVVAITGNADGMVRVWDLLSGRQTGGALRGGEAIEGVTAGTLPDGRVVVAAADSFGTVRAWDLVSRQPVGVPVRCGRGQALGLATARVGDQVLGLATGQDSGLQLWQLETGIPVRDRLTGHPLAQRQPGTGTLQGGRAVATAVLAGRPVAITGNGDGLLLWDLQGPAPIERRLEGSDGLIRSLAAVQLTTGQAMAVTGGSRGVQVWDLSADEPDGELLAGHDGSVEAVTLLRSPDGRALAVSASRDRSVRAYDVPDDARSARPASQKIGVVEAVAAAYVSPERAIAVTGGDTGVQVWDLAEGRVPVRLSGYASPVVSVALAELQAGVLVVTGHLNGWISANWADGTRVSCAELGDMGTAASLAALQLADGQVLTVAGGWGGALTVWDPLIGVEAGQPLPGHTAAVNAVTGTTIDGRVLVISGGEDGHVRIRDLDAHRDPQLTPVIPPVDVDIGVKVSSLAVGALADGRPSVVVGGDDGTVRILDVRDGTVTGGPWPTCSGGVAAVAIGPPDDGRVAIFTGGVEAKVQAWDASSGEAIGEPLPVPGPVRAITFQLPQNSLVVGGSGVAVARPRHSGR